MLKNGIKDAEKAVAVVAPDLTLVCDLVLVVNTLKACSYSLKRLKFATNESVLACYFQQFAVIVILFKFLLVKLLSFRL